MLLASAFAAPVHAQTTNFGLLQKYYGLPAPPVIQTSDVTVGTTATRLLKANAARIETVIIDTGSSSCTVSTSNQVTTTSGVVLAANGGVQVLTWRDDLTMPTKEHWAVCSSAGGTLHVVELILQ